MFTETAGSRKAIGDVDVLWHDGLYHLFHLVLPNHDFIAHAVSTDGIHWRRVRNALFIGDPGSWDDLMLWTMHVSPDPHQPGRWRMFYTGLSRRDRGNYQRLGMAVSDDLYHWEKHPVHWRDNRGPNDPPEILEARRKSCRKRPGDTTALIDEESCFPLSPDPAYYESDLDQQLESFRLNAALKLDGKGKCGLLFRIDPESHDGYYLSLDLLKGVAQLRAWGADTGRTGEHIMSFDTLQGAAWHTTTPGEARLSLLVFGSYIELSVDGYLVLSLADQRFARGHVGVYLETACLTVDDLELRRLRSPAQMDDQLVGG